MITHHSVLVQLLDLVEAIPTPPPPPHRSRGRPTFYSDRLFLKALVIMIVRRLHKVHELPEVLKEPSPEMENVREACVQTQRLLVASRGGSYPHTDAGVEVRWIFHKLRSVANENFNEHFKAIFDVHGPPSHQGGGCHRAVCFGGGIRLSARVALPS